MVSELPSIEGHVLDSRLDRPFSHSLTDGFGGVTIPAGPITFGRTCSHQGPPRLVIDHLGVDVLVAAKDTQPRTPGTIPSHTVVYAEAPSPTSDRDSFLRFHDSSTALVATVADRVIHRLQQMPCPASASRIRHGNGCPSPCRVREDVPLECQPRTARRPVCRNRKP